MPFIAVEENLRFLIIEVQKQVARARTCLADPRGRSGAAVSIRDDYIDNLKTIIQRKCFALAASSSGEGGTPLPVLNAINTITANLEHIADYCENVIEQLKYVVSVDRVIEEDFDAFLDEIERGLDLIYDAAFSLDLQIASRICRCEPVTDRLYSARLNALLSEIQDGGDAGDLVTLIFIYRYLERMGDSLLNIGEAVMSASLGERVKIGQFEALEDSLASAGVDPADVTLRTMAETRSGCKIDRVDTSRTSMGEKAVVFKEGSAEKVAAERDGILAWHELEPGIAPQIHAFTQDEDSSSILLEYLDGLTFDKILLDGSQEQVAAALQRLCATLDRLWQKSREDAEAPAQFVRQLRDRLPAVYSLHPEFLSESAGIGDLVIPSFGEMLDRAEALESRIHAPFSVFIHGDFNVDNVIFDRGTGDPHFIDLHRSRRMDYVQDVSVFLVSNFRLRAPHSRMRRRITEVIRGFYEFACGFAERQGDTTFQLRLALGLTRSMASSSRFVLDPKFSRKLFLRARYLLELLGRADLDHPESFKIPTDALID